ncbi:MAG TPA: AsnC family transcriptional regulator [Microvirga sp.]|jgi:hypothetical protein|nr:AsnC family transcriptional regulator [Microvirga sp.]
MQFQIVTNHAGSDLSGDPTFTLERVFASGTEGRRDVSHLLDRTYGYRSLREVQWHLADRFGVQPRNVRVHGADIRREHPMS